MFFPIQIMDIQVIHKHFKKPIKIGPANFYHDPRERIGCIFHAKSMTIQLNSPNFVINTYLQMSSGAILICQNPNCRSKVENYYALPSCISTFSIRSMDNESCRV
jgi:hypothetical protein